jgi:hypothetical protein
MEREPTIFETKRGVGSYVNEKTNTKTAHRAVFILLAEVLR